ncbi:hydroxyacid oxidase 1, partial [Trichonephila inaurata madagascariensis]
VPCTEEYQPPDCDFSKLDMVTVDDYDRCGPAKLTLHDRNYFLAAAGRRTTYKRNKDAFDEITIVPKMLRDVSQNSLETSTLGIDLDFPIGLSPVALQMLADPRGELATVDAVSPFRTIMIMSSFATTTIEDVGRAAAGTSVTMWMQMYIFDNRTWTLELVQRAEKAGFKGIVLTADSPVETILTCNGRRDFLFPEGVYTQNINFESVKFSAAASYDDITWLTTITSMPIIVKGLLSGEDAKKAVRAGASAILVSNHGGRQLDGDPATIEALPTIVDAVRSVDPSIDVYMDGGIRSGYDVYKAIARGAKMVFFGRPIIWGLAMGGSNGVREVLTLLRDDFNDTMLLAGSSNVRDIKRDSLMPEVPLIEEHQQRTVDYDKIRTFLDHYHLKAR